MQLPLKTSPDEAIHFVKTLMTTHDGCYFENVEFSAGKKIVDSRKLNAYIAWGMLAREHENLKLSERGKCLAIAQSNEEIQAIFQDVIRGIDGYYDVIKRCFNDSHLIVSSVEVAEYWRANKKYDMASETENTMKDRAVCFFKVCEQAGLAKLIVGRRGQPTRLSLYEERIKEFLRMVVSKEKDAVGEKTEMNENKKADKIVNNKETKALAGDDMVSLPIPFIDGRCAVLNMPQNVNKEDVCYVFDMLQLILSRQYGFDK